MDPISLEEQITRKTKAIIPVHFAGSSCDMTKIKIAKKFNLKIIEDCCRPMVQNTLKKIRFFW